MIDTNAAREMLIECIGCSIGDLFSGDDIADMLDEIDRLREVIVEERAKRIQESRSGDFVSSVGEHIFCIVNMEECRLIARQQLEGKI